MKHMILIATIATAKNYVVKTCSQKFDSDM